MKHCLKTKFKNLFCNEFFIQTCRDKSVFMKGVQVRLFVLVNIKSYLNLEQLHFLYQQSCYDKFQLLLIESCMDEQKRIGGEHVLIIDNDSCVIC